MVDYSSQYHHPPLAPFLLQEGDWGRRQLSVQNFEKG